MMYKSKQPRIVFAALGTKGDFLPLLGLAKEMVFRGYECHILGNEPFEAETVAAGVGFTPVTVEQANNLTTLEENVNKILFPAYPKTYEYFKRISRDQRPTAVVNTEAHNPSSLMCELYDLPMFRLYLAPYKIRSLLAPFWPLSKKCEGPLGHTFAKYTLPKIFAGWDRSPVVMSTIAKYRQAWGLPPSDSGASTDPWIRRRLALFPNWFCAPAADWPPLLDMTSFIFTASTGTLPEALRAFVARWGKPMVFTPGTGVADVKAFFESAKRCCDELGCPGVFLTRHHVASEAELGPRIITLPYLDLQLMLAEALMLVHHGGIGTTACAMRAGIPQIISPQMYDQPDNGHRIATLKVGAVLERKDLSGSALARTALRLMKDPATAMALHNVKERLARENGIRDTADIMEREFSWNGLKARTEAVSTIGTHASGMSISN